MRRAPPAPPWAWSASSRREGSQQPCTTRAKAWTTARASGESCSAPPPPPTWRQTPSNPPRRQTPPLARGRRPRPPPPPALTSRVRPTTTSWPPSRPAPSWRRWRGGWGAGKEGGTARARRTWASPSTISTCWTRWRGWEWPEPRGAEQWVPAPSWGPWVGCEGPAPLLGLMAWGGTGVTQLWLVLAWPWKPRGLRNKSRTDCWAVSWGENTDTVHTVWYQHATTDQLRNHCCGSTQSLLKALSAHCFKVNEKFVSRKTKKYNLVTHPILVSCAQNILYICVCVLNRAPRHAKYLRWFCCSAFDFCVLTSVSTQKSDLTSGQQENRFTWSFFHCYVTGKTIFVSKLRKLLSYEVYFKRSAR